MKVDEVKKIFLITFLCILIFGAYAPQAFAVPKPPKVEYDTEYYNNLRKQYKGVTSDECIMDALEILKTSMGEYSYKAIMGDNITGKKIKIELKDLSTI